MTAKLLACRAVRFAAELLELQREIGQTPNEHDELGEVDQQCQGVDPAKPPDCTRRVLLDMRAHEFHRRDEMPSKRDRDEEKSGASENREDEHAREDDHPGTPRAALLGVSYRAGVLA